MKCFDWKKIILIFVFFLTFNFCACSSDAQVLCFESAYYAIDKLEEESLTNTNFYISEENMGDHCYVTKTIPHGKSSEKLVVNNDRATAVHMSNGVNGFFVGLNYDEFASGVYFIPCSGIKNLASQKILDNRCVALFNSSNSIEGECYVVTSWNYYDLGNEVTSFYRLTSPMSDNGYLCFAEKVCDIASEEAVTAIQVDENTFYVATCNSLYTVTKKGNVKSIEVPAEWNALRVNSMVEVNNALYFGTKYGVLEYSIQKDKFTWFPMDYEDAVK